MGDALGSDVVGCIACDANAGRLQAPGGQIHSDGAWIVEHSLSPVLLRGWLILKPSRHVEHIADLTMAETTGLGELLARVSSALRVALNAERVYICSFGESVNHVHFYMIPRYAEMPRNGVDVINMMFSEARPWACGDAEAAEAAARVRSRLRGYDVRGDGRSV